MYDVESLLLWSLN